MHPIGRPTPCTFGTAPPPPADWRPTVMCVRVLHELINDASETHTTIKALEAEAAPPSLTLAGLNQTGCKKSQFVINKLLNP